MTMTTTLTRPETEFSQMAGGRSCEGCPRWQDAANAGFCKQIHKPEYGNLHPVCRRCGHCVLRGQPTRAIGHTFEFTFSLPKPRAEPTPEQIEAQKEARRAYEQKRNQTPERKELQRRVAQEEGKRPGSSASVSYVEPHPSRTTSGARPAQRSTG